MLIAEELEADWSKIRVEHAPAAPAYFHTAGRGQRTGGSSSTRSEFDRLRQVGATAREMSIQAAARRWKTDADELRAENGFVVRGTERLSYGKLAAEAAKLDAADARSSSRTPRTGRSSASRKSGWTRRRRSSAPPASGWTCSFPGLLTAVVAARAGLRRQGEVVHAATGRWRCPGSKRSCRSPRGVAVVAEHFWAASRGREALTVEWDLGPERRASTPTRYLRAAARARPGARPGRRRGRATSTAALRGARAHASRP